MNPKQNTSEPKPAATDKSKVQLPTLGILGWLRFLWRQLTSMQTALVLLMLLAIAAIPGSLYPQRSVNPGLTEEFLNTNGTYGEILDALGFFNVFSSPWFSAIYLLLFISLIGCVVPRISVYAKQLRSKPPKTPKRLDRFSGYLIKPLGESVDAKKLQHEAFKLLKSKRYRVSKFETDQAFSVSAERGYLREAGNLLFHLALVGVLIGVGAGYLTSYRGQITVVEEQGFANSLTQYDSFEPGPWFDPANLPQFRFTLDEFRAEFNTDASNPENFGLPTLFEADLTVFSAQAGEFEQTVRVNQPLIIAGTGVYLLGNGYAPVIKVSDPNGKVVAEGPIITIARDTHYTSQLILKMPDARPQQLAVVGIFAPTATIDELGPRSQYAGLVDPKLFLTVHQGDLGLDQGIAQNAYSIDVSTLTQVTGTDDRPLLISLAPGESFQLSDGTLIEFENILRYAAFDIKYDPFKEFTLIMALLSVLGLVLSLFIPRRRIWIRISPLEAKQGKVHSNVSQSAENFLQWHLEVAGLARSEDFQLDADVAELEQEMLVIHAVQAGRSESSVKKD